MCDQYQESVLRTSNWKIFKFLFSSSGFSVQPLEEASLWRTLPKHLGPQAAGLGFAEKGNRTASHAPPPIHRTQELYVLNFLRCGHAPRGLERPCVIWLYCQNLASDGKYIRLLQQGIKKLGELQLEESGL